MYFETFLSTSRRCSVPRSSQTPGNKHSTQSVGNG